MKSFFKNITQRLTVPNNYNTEQIINPLKVFSTAGSEVVPVKQVTADVLKALDMAKVFLESEEFEFKERLIRDILSTNYLGEVTCLQSHNAFRSVALEVFYRSVQLAQVYKHSEDFYNHLVNTALQLNRSTSEEGLLRSLILLIDMEPAYRQQVPEQIYNSVINYAQVSTAARGLLYSKPFLFNREAVLTSVYAGLKNELVLVPFEDPTSTIKNSIANVTNLLEVASKYVDFTRRTEIQAVVEYGVEEALLLINKVCFGNRIGFKTQLTNAGEVTFENEPYCAEMLYLAACILKELRGINLDAFRCAVRELHVEDESVFVLSHDRDTDSTTIVHTGGGDFVFTVPQLVLLFVLQKLRLDNTTLCVLNEVLNIQIEIYCNAYLRPEETLQFGLLQVKECHRNVACVINSTPEDDELHRLILGFLTLDGDLLRENALYNEVAQFSAGVERAYKDLIRPGAGAEGETSNPITGMIQLKIVQMCDLVLNNDFNGDDCCEVVTIEDEHGRSEKIRHTNYVFNEQEIDHLADFYELAAEFLYQTALANPIVWKHDIRECVYKHLVGSVKKIGRLVAFIKANHSIFTGGRSEAAWISRYDGITKCVVDGEKRIRAAVCGYMVSILKDEGVPASPSGAQVLG